MKKHARRLTLSRETLLRLDDRKLRYLHGGVALAAESENACTSPRCALTEWDSCTCV